MFPSSTGFKKKACLIVKFDFKQNFTNIYSRGMSQRNRDLDETNTKAKTI